MLTFGDALAALKAGQSVRRAVWGDGQNVSLTTGMNPKLVLAIPPEEAGVEQRDSPQGPIMQFSLSTVLAEDWEIITP